MQLMFMSFLQPKWKHRRGDYTPKWKTFNLLTRNYFKTFCEAIDDEHYDGADDEDGVV